MEGADHRGHGMEGADSVCKPDPPACIDGVTGALNRGTVPRRTGLRDCRACGWCHWCLERKHNPGKGSRCGQCGMHASLFPWLNEHLENSTGEYSWFIEIPAYHILSAPERCQLCVSSVFQHPVLGYWTAAQLSWDYTEFSAISAWNPVFIVVYSRLYRRWFKRCSPWALGDLVPALSQTVLSPVALA